MRTLLKFDLDLHDGTRVRRFHAKDIIRDQTVGEHTCGMLLIALYLSDGVMSNAMWTACLRHDLPERETGDIPAPVIRSNAALRVALHNLEKDFFNRYFLPITLTAEEQKILSIADSLDCLVYCANEVVMGNHSLRSTVEAIGDALTEKLKNATPDLFSRASHVRTQAMLRAGTKGAGR